MINILYKTRAPTRLDRYRAYETSSHALSATDVRFPLFAAFDFAPAASPRARFRLSSCLRPNVAYSARLSALLFHDVDASFVVVVVVGSRVASSSLVVIVPASPTVANCRRRSAAVGEVATAFRVARAPRSSLAPRLAAGRRIRSRARASDEFAARRGEARGPRESRE